MNETLLSLITIAIEPSMVIQNVVTCLNTMLLLSVTGETRREKPLRTAAVFTLLFLLLNVMNAIWELLFHAAGAFIVTHILLLCCYALLRRMKPSPALLLTMLLFHSYECAAIITSSLIPLLLENAAHGSVIEIILRNGFVIASLLPAWLFHTHSLLRFGEIQTPVSLFGLFTALVTLFLTCYFHFGARAWFDTSPALFVLLAFMSILALNLVTYYLIWSVCVHSKREREVVAENYAMKSERYMLELSQRNLEDMRRIRHDIRNHYAYLKYLCDQKQYDELSVYLSQLSESFIAPLSAYDFGNRSVNAVLNLEQAKAQTKGLTLDCRVIVPPQLPFTELRLCSLITNLIDNALEACERYQLYQKPVEVGINQRGAMLYLCVRNPLPDSIKTIDQLGMQSTKKDKTAHGYGLHIIRSIIREYNGCLSRSVEDGCYRVDVMLDMRWQETNASAERE